MRYKIGCIEQICLKLCLTMPWCFENMDIEKINEFSK